MQLKKYFGGFSFLGILGALGKASDVGEGARVLLNLGGLLNITYDLFYNACIALGVIAFCYALSQIIPYIYKNRNYFKVYPDTSIKEALDYITDDSTFGKSLPDSQYGRDDAVKALKKLILKNRVRLYGTNDANPIPVQIGLNEITKDNLQIIYRRGSGYKDPPLALFFVSKGEKGALYKNLAIPLRQLKKWFPHKHGY